jgi:hypothetical protein
VRRVPLSEIKDDFPRFLRRMEQARSGVREGRGIRIEELER